MLATHFPAELLRDWSSQQELRARGSPFSWAAPWSQPTGLFPSLQVSLKAKVTPEPPVRHKHNLLIFLKKLLK